MENVHSILSKLSTISNSKLPLSQLEMDLMLEHTRRLYEAILGLKHETFEQEELRLNKNEKVENVTDLEQVGINIDIEQESPIVQHEQMIMEEKKQEETILEVNQIEEDSTKEAVEYTDDSVTLKINEVQFETIEVPYSRINEQIDKEILTLDINKPEQTKTSSTPIEEKTSTEFKVWQKDIRTYIGINDKYNFISELFGSNTEAYEEILNEINQCESKNDAFLFLENSGITTLYQWKEEGLSEQVFHNILSQFFSSR